MNHQYEYVKQGFLAALLTALVLTASHIVDEQPRGKSNLNQNSTAGLTMDQEVKKATHKVKKLSPQPGDLILLSFNTLTGEKSASDLAAEMARLYPKESGVKVMITVGEYPKLELLRGFFK